MLPILCDYDLTNTETEEKHLVYVVENNVATPVLIKTHLFNYAKYNNVRFTQSDFVEQISFDKLVLENALI